MSSVGLNRASVFAITEETTAGTYVPPSSGTDFVPLRPSNELSYEPEQLKNDELLNDIGEAKSFIGKEIVSGKHSAYLKHSGVEGQAPELATLYQSIMGGKQVASTEYDLVAGSTKSVVNVGAGEGASFIEGQGLLFKIGAGYEIRNVDSISTDALTLNFDLPSAPAAGVNTGKAITFYPLAQGHPSFSTTKYIGNGFAIEESAGNTVKEMSVKMDANGFAEVDFSFEGTRYYFNPITITASSKYLDVTDDGGTFAVSVEEKIYKTPIELADAVQAALEAGSAETYTVTFSSSTGKFTIASGSSLLSLLWNTGTNAANSIKTKMGFSNTNDTGAVTYDSDSAQSYAAPYTPSYDTVDAIVVKGAELFIGNQSDNICFCAQSVAVSVQKGIEDVDCICEDSGILEKIAVSRTATMEVTAVLKKHDVALLDALLKNSSIQVMMNAGPKSGGNWIAGKCANFYMQSATVAKYVTSGDSFAQVNISLKGFVSSSTKDIFVNFL